MLVIKTTKQAKEYLDLTDDETERLLEVAALFSKETILYHCRILDETFQTMQKAGFAKRTVAEMALVKMCDNSLQTSDDALLSRISKLENIIAMGGVQPIAVAPAPTKKKAEQKTDDLPKDNKKLQDSKKSVGVADTPKAERTSSQATLKDDMGLKVLRGWNEIAEKASVGEGSVLGFLKTAKAFVDTNGRVYVRFPNDFARSMAEKPNIKEAISAAIRINTGKNVSVDDIVFEIFKGDEDDYSELDELNS